MDHSTQQMLNEIEILRQGLAAAQSVCKQLADRVVAQSEILTSLAEKKSTSTALNIMEDMKPLTELVPLNSRWQHYNTKEVYCCSGYSTCHAVPPGSQIQVKEYVVLFTPVHNNSANGFSSYYVREIFEIISVEQDNKEIVYTQRFKRISSDEFSEKKQSG